MPSFLHSVFGCLSSISKCNINPSKRKQFRTRQLQKLRYQRKRILGKRLKNLSLSSSTSSIVIPKHYISFIKKTFPYYQVKCSELAGPNTDQIQLWLTIKSLMIHVLDDGRKIHRHWKVIKYLKRFSNCNLSIVFDDLMNLTVEFRSKWELQCFLITCQSLGRILVKNRNLYSRRGRLRSLYFLRFCKRKKYPIIRELADDQLNEKQKLEQRQTLDLFLHSNEILKSDY